MNFLNVSPPHPADATVRRSEITTVKLARNVSVLFGVDVPENPTGVVWVSDFSKVAVGDVGRGGPKATRKDAGYLATKSWYLVDRSLVAGPAGRAGDYAAVPARRIENIEEIPAATLNRYAPDTKAAAILAGAETLFSELEETFEDVLRVLGTLDDGSPLADFMRVGAWASLIAEVYRSQPALFVAAVQARLTQRAALSSWSPRLLGEDSTLMASCEFGQQEKTKWEPVHLGILDRTIREFVQPFSDSADAGDDLQEPNREYLIDGLVDRWCRHLTQSQDRGLAWIVQESQRYSVEVHQSAQIPLGRFISEVLLLSPQILPFGAKDLQDLCSFDAKDPLHRQRVRPRVPSLAELSSLPERSKVAVIHTIGCLHRVLRANSSFNNREMLREVSEDQERISRLADALLGREAPQSVIARILWTRGIVSANRDSDPSLVKSYWPELSESLQKLQQLRDQGKISAGEWIDIFHTTSPVINSMVGDLALQPGLLEESQRVYMDLMESWHEVFGLLDIDINLEIENSQHIEHLDVSLARAVTLFHNYLGVALRSEDLVKKLQTIRFGYRVVVPLRRMISRSRGNDAAVRLTMQLIAGAASRLATEAEEPEIHEEMLQLCSNLLDDLLDTKLLRELLSGERLPERSNDLSALISIVASGVRLVDAGVDLPKPLLDSVGRSDELLGQALMSLGAETSENSTSKTERVETVKRLHEQWKMLQKTARAGLRARPFSNSYSR